MNFKQLFEFALDPEIQAKRDFLKHLPLFKGLRNKDLIHVIKSLQERVYLKGETIFSEGDIGRGLFITVSGSVKLTHYCSEQKKEELLAVLHPGEYFGEMALLEEMPRMASAVASENAKVFILYKVKLDSLLFDSPRVGVVIATHLAQVLSARLRAKNPPAKQEAQIVPLGDISLNADKR